MNKNFIFNKTLEEEYNNSNILNYHARIPPSFTEDNKHIHPPCRGVFKWDLQSNLHVTTNTVYMYM